MNMQFAEKTPYGIKALADAGYPSIEVSGKLPADEIQTLNLLNGIVFNEDEEVYKSSGKPVTKNRKEDYNPRWHYNLSKAKFYFSSYFIKNLGIEEESFYKYNIIQNLMTKESQQEFIKGFNKVVYKRGNYQIKLDFIKTDGSLLSVVQTGNPVINKDDKVTDIEGAVCIISSSDKNAENINSKLLQQNKRLLAFADIASHNLRSHASNLQMTLQVLNTTSNEDEMKFCIDSLQKISVSLSQTITNIYELTKNETMVQNMITTVKFADVMKSVESSLAQQIKESGAVIETNFSSFPQITYVHAYLESILLNLVSNAIKYRHPQRLPLIQIRTYLENNSLMLEVTDNGSGIDLKKHGDELFKRNRTFHNHPDSKGVGLLITKKQVESMGGSINVESKLATGTKFIVKLL